MRHTSARYWTSTRKVGRMPIVSFNTIVVALRPLRVEELAEFLAFEFEDEESPIFQADCRPEDPREAVLSTCSSLIAVVDDYGRAIVQFSPLFCQGILDIDADCRRARSAILHAPGTSSFTSHTRMSFDSAPAGRSDTRGNA